jgi:hypothetical protein
MVSCSYIQACVLLDVFLFSVFLCFDLLGFTALFQARIASCSTKREGDEKEITFSLGKGGIMALVYDI